MSGTGGPDHHYGSRMFVLRNCLMWSCANMSRSDRVNGMGWSKGFLVLSRTQCNLLPTGSGGCGHHKLAYSYIFITASTRDHTRVHRHTPALDIGPDLVLGLRSSHMYCIGPCTGRLVWPLLADWKHDRWLLEKAIPNSLASAGPVTAGLAKNHSRFYGAGGT